MYSIDNKVNEVIKTEYSIYKDMMLNHDWNHKIKYNADAILRSFYESRRMALSIEKCNKFIDWLLCNQDKVIVYKMCCGISNSTNEFHLLSIGEIEFDVSYWFKNLTESKRELINKMTSLYISGDYGYIYAAYDYIAIDFDKIDLTEVFHD